ncbi:GNAT family protein, partial [Anaerococcus porci]
MENTLVGNKIILKLIEKEDMKKRAEWINDIEIQATLNYDFPTSISKTQAWFQKAQMDSSRREFSIFNKETNEYIGFCGLFDIDYKARKAEHHCVIGNKAYHSKGYGIDAYKVIVNYGFKELGLNRIYAFQRTNNIAAHKLVEKLGWTREGLLREDLYSHGEIRDRYIISILRSEWKNNKI